MSWKPHLAEHIESTDARGRKIDKNLGEAAATRHVTPRTPNARPKGPWRQPRPSADELRARVAEGSRPKACGACRWRSVAPARTRCSGTSSRPAACNGGRAAAAASAHPLDQTAVEPTIEPPAPVADSPSHRSPPTLHRISHPRSSRAPMSRSQWLPKNGRHTRRFRYASRVSTCSAPQLARRRPQRTRRVRARSEPPRPGVSAPPTAGIPPEAPAPVEEAPVAEAPVGSAGTRNAGRRSGSRRAGRPGPRRVAPPHPLAEFTALASSGGGDDYSFRRR